MTTEALFCSKCGAPLEKIGGFITACPRCSQQNIIKADDPVSQSIREDGLTGAGILALMKQSKQGIAEANFELQKKKFLWFREQALKEFPVCTFPNPETAKFCMDCGSSFGNLRVTPPQTPQENRATNHVGVVIKNGVLQKQCPECSSFTRHDAQFCPSCGHQYFTQKTQTAPPSKKLCPQCGESNLPDTPFCVSCGHKFAR